MNFICKVLAVLLVALGTSACTDQKQFDANTVDIAKTCKGTVSLSVTKSNFGNSMTVTCAETKEQRSTSNDLK